MSTAIVFVCTREDIGMTAFIVFSCVIVIVRTCVRDQLINEAESSPSEMAKPMKATLGLRLLIIGVALLIGGGAIWSLFNK